MAVVVLTASTVTDNRQSARLVNGQSTAWWIVRKVEKVKRGVNDVCKAEGEALVAWLNNHASAEQIGRITILLRDLTELELLERPTYEWEDTQRIVDLHFRILKTKSLCELPLEDDEWLPGFCEADAVSVIETLEKFGSAERLQQCAARCGKWVFARYTAIATRRKKGVPGQSFCSKECRREFHDAKGRHRKGPSVNGAPSKAHSRARARAA